MNFNLFIKVKREDALVMLVHVKYGNTESALTTESLEG